MQRFYLWLTAILLLCFLGLGYFVLRQKTEIVAFSLRRADADRSVDKEALDLQRRLAAAKAARAEAEKKLAGLKGRAALLRAGRAAEANDGMRTIHIGDIIKEHPEYAAIWAAQSRRGLLRQYGPFLAALNLPPEQLAKLKDLLAERALSQTDAQQAAQAAGLQPGTAAWRAALKQAELPIDQEMTGIVGTDGVRFATDLQNQGGALNQVQFTYAPDLNDAGANLTADQTTALAQAIADANYTGKSTANRPANYNQVDPDTSLTPHESRILAAAAATLTAAQIDVVKADMVEAHQQQAIVQQYTGGANGPVSIVP